MGSPMINFDLSDQGGSMNSILGMFWIRTAQFPHGNIQLTNLGVRNRRLKVEI